MGQKIARNDLYSEGDDSGENAGMRLCTAPVRLRSFGLSCKAFPANAGPIDDFRAPDADAITPPKLRSRC